MALGGLATPQAVQIGVLAGFGNLLIYNHFVGMPVGEITSNVEPYNSNIESAERKALIASSIFTVAVATFVRSWETFAIAGMAIIVADIGIKHANAVSPLTGKIATPQSTGIPDASNYPSLADYSQDQAA
jgi:hypothetical protein